MSLVSAFVFALGAVVCHQQPERSFFVDGQQLPVCARCSGLYLSGLAGLAAWWGVKLARGWRPMPVSSAQALRVVAVVAIPTGLSILTALLGVWDGSNLTRAVLAAPLGLSAGAIVAAVAAKDLR